MGGWQGKTLKDTVGKAPFGLSGISSQFLTAVNNRDYDSAATAYNSMNNKGKFFAKSLADNSSYKDGNFTIETSSNGQKNLQWFFDQKSQAESADAAKDEAADAVKAATANVAEPQQSPESSSAREAVQNNVKKRKGTTGVVLTSRLGADREQVGTASNKLGVM